MYNSLCVYIYIYTYIYIYIKHTYIYKQLYIYICTQLDNFWLTHKSITIIGIMNRSIISKVFSVLLQVLPYWLSPHIPIHHWLTPRESLMCLFTSWVSLHFQELHIHYILFWGGDLASFMKHNYFKILPCCCVLIVDSFLVHGIYHSLFTHSPLDGCISLLVLPLTKYHKLSGLNTEIYYLSFGGPKYKIKCQQDWVLLRVMTENLFQIVNNCPRVHMVFFSVYLSLNFPFC